LGTATVYVSSGTLIYPIEITVPNHDYSTGTAIQLTNLYNGMDEIDGYVLYTYPLGSNVFQLYYDSILSEGVDGTNFTPYQFGGTSTRVLLSSNNIAIGTNAGKSLFDGERNFFLGDYIAQNLTTGSYNFFIGHEVGNNLITGNGNVSIMGDNLVDGQDNQVNIGGIFYYNGAGYLQLNSDTGLGLGTAATGTNTGALAVLGGISVSENIITFGPIDIRDLTQSTATTNGALLVGGGAGIALDLNVGGQVSANQVKIADAIITSNANTVNTTTLDLIVVDTYSLSNYRSADYLVQIESDTGLNDSFQISKLLLIANSSTASVSEYGVTYTNGALGTWSAIVTGGTTVSLEFNPSTATNMIFNVLRTGITS
jgi:hypothetical protein